ncbi:MAG: excinuclease ABC subunit UvrB [Minisyncoccia bacterium]
MEFKIESPFKPAGDQPQAIEALAKGVAGGARHQTLLGVTGSGKTFTVANVIECSQMPALVIAHNKTLAAQLAAEYREFFPESAVHYFVSYYDYYQPEAYIPHSDTYIEKEAQINEEIDRLRHASTQALLTRRDCIIVASVSCIYALGSPEEYRKVHLELAPGIRKNRAELIRELVRLYFERTNADLSPGQFRALGNAVEVMPTGERVLYRIEFSGDRIDRVRIIDAITRAEKEAPETAIFLFPAKHYVTAEDERDRAVADIKIELKEQLVRFERAGKTLEAERLKRRTQHDLALIREIGYCNGIENYSRHFDGRNAGDPPYTLLDYFPHKEDGTPDFLTIIDESHATLPQIAGMSAGDRARKNTLVEFGFRLPSAVDNRPLTFDEFDARVGQIIYTSATPAAYEREKSRGHVVAQIIRPTGLLDPQIDIRPVTGIGDAKGQVEDFLDEAEAVIARGNRILVTTLTKKMAEDLSEFLSKRGMASRYLHSDIQTLERVETLTDFRKGAFDVLVGVNLLREGLDLPEVELVAVFDADKEGFLRSETSLIQTMGRAARNSLGRVILYADEETPSLRSAVEETRRRRALQMAYNKKHGITPTTIQKRIRDITEELRSEHTEAVASVAAIDAERYRADPKHFIAEKRAAMEEAVQELDFETAAILRDEILALEAAPGASKKRPRRQLQK